MNTAMVDHTNIGSASPPPLSLGSSAERGHILQAPSRRDSKNFGSNASIGSSFSAQSNDLSSLGHIRRPNVADPLGRPHTADLSSRTLRSPFSRVQRKQSALRPNSSSKARSVAYREANIAKSASAFDRAYNDPTMLPPYIADAIASRSAPFGTDSTHSVSTHSVPRAGDGTEDPHLVRLTPLGKTYVSYFARPAPFVKYVSEKRLSFEEEEALREKATSANILEAQLEEMKKMFLEYHKKTEEAKVSKSVSKFKSLLERKGDVDGKGSTDSVSRSEPHLKTKKGVDTTESAGGVPNPVEDGEGVQSMMRTNVLLRLRLAGMAFKKTGAQNITSTHHNSSQGSSHKHPRSLDRFNDDMEELQGEISAFDKSTGGSALPPALVDAFACGLGEGESQEAEALRAAMTHIKELNMKLSVLGAKTAASSLVDRMRRSDDKSGEIYDDDIDDDLKSQIKELTGEVESLKKQLRNTTHAGREFARALKDQPGGSKSIRDYFLANPPKVVVIPMFFPTAAKSSDEKTSILDKFGPKSESHSGESPNKESIETDASPNEIYEETAVGEGLEGDALGDNDDFEDEASTPSKFGPIKRSHSSHEDSRDMQGWAKWQIHDDEEGTSGASSSSGRHNPGSSEKQPRAAQSASPAPSGGQINNERPVDKNGSRARHTQAPLDVSPLAKYLKWHAKDKRVLYDKKQALTLAHDILEKKAIQETIDERTGKPLSPLAFFFEDYFFRTFGEKAKFNLRCFVHSLVHHKEKGDRRAELFALICGLHHPELYSKQLSCAFMRLIRNIFHNNLKKIKVSLDKYDSKSRKSNFLISRKEAYAGLIGPKGKPNAPSTWEAPELLHLTSMSEMKSDLVAPVLELKVVGNDQRKATDVDGIIFLMIDYYVVSAIRMQLRLKSFFVSLMSGSTTSKEFEAAAAERASEESNNELEAQAAQLAEQSRSSMHITWEDFKAFNSLVELQTGTELKNDEELMELFSKFHDIMDEEEDEEDEENEWKAAELVSKESELRAQGAKGWNFVRNDLDKITFIVNQRKKAIENEARVLAALCYQHALYVPLSAAGDIDKNVSSSMLKWSKSKSIDS